MLEELPGIPALLAQAGGNCKQSAAADRTLAGLNSMAELALNHRLAQGSFRCVAASADKCALSWPTAFAHCGCSPAPPLAAALPIDRPFLPLVPLCKWLLLKADELRRALGACAWTLRWLQAEQLDRSGRRTAQALHKHRHHGGHHDPLPAELSHGIAPSALPVGVPVSST